MKQQNTHRPQLPLHTVIGSACLWVKDSNGNELNCGFVFTHNGREWLIKYHTKRKEHVAIEAERTGSGLISWRNEDWIRRVAKYTTIIGYVKDKTNHELIERWQHYL